MNAVPSNYRHPLYRVTKWTDDYGRTGEDRVPAGTTNTLEPEADVVSSEVVGTDHHTVMLDLDVPAVLVPSSTPGHSHLYVDVAMPWRQYRRFLKAAYRAGLIEEGYYQASISRKGTHLRLPWVTKS